MILKMIWVTYKWMVRMRIVSTKKLSFYVVFVCFFTEWEQPYLHCTTPLHRTSRKNPLFPFSPIIMVFVENVGNNCGVTVHDYCIKFRRACYLFTLVDSCILIYPFCRCIYPNNFFAFVSQSDIYIKINTTEISYMHIFETVQLYEPITKAKPA